MILEAKDLGMLIDTPLYTTLINSYYKAKNLDKCWSIYYDDIVNLWLIKAANVDVRLDENVIGLMIEIASHSRDTEKAVNFFNDLEVEGFT